MTQSLRLYGYYSCLSINILFNINSGIVYIDIVHRSGGTVGAVGIDVNGHLVSCTSTGGITGKMKGRVGDTPIPG